MKKNNSAKKNGPTILEKKQKSDVFRLFSKK